LNRNLRLWQGQRKSERRNPKEFVLFRRIGRLASGAGQGFNGSRRDSSARDAVEAILQ